MAGVRRSPQRHISADQLSASHRERLVEELRADPGLAEEYLNAAADDEDPSVYLSALRTVAEAQGMAAVAQAAGIPRESLYRALSAGGNPRFSTLQAVLRAAGLKLVVRRRSTPIANGNQRQK